jgi:hypothetical protein
MKVSIIQSNYIPWRGYFDFIDDMDLTVFYDDVQYTKNDWRNRNKLKTVNGAEWITVPVHKLSLSQLIQETPIDYRGWEKKHIKSIIQWYAKAHFFKDYSEELFAILEVKYATISELNITLCHWIMQKLEIDTPARMSSEFILHGSKTERLIDLLKQIGAVTYVSGPAGKGYLDERLFREAGIGLEYKSYDYPAYPQLWGEFISEVTVLDLLFNTGPEARNYLKSRSPNQLAVAI